MSLVVGGSLTATLITLIGFVAVGQEYLDRGDKPAFSAVKTLTLDNAILAELPWNLTFVDADHPLMPEPDIELTTLSNGETVDTRIYPELQQMIDAARVEGHELFVRSGYRTRETQQEILDAMIRDFESSGSSPEDAASKALQTVALPGTSEHELGLAIDINPGEHLSARESDATYRWLADHCHEYGFIVRYPANKTHITGISYEPWHFRYVGREDATAMAEGDLTLEEYLDNYRP